MMNLVEARPSWPPCSADGGGVLGMGVWEAVCRPQRQGDPRDPPSTQDEPVLTGRCS